MREATVNTILTMVIRMKETIILMTPAPDTANRYIEWKDIFAEPRIMEPSKSAMPVATGIASCVMYLNGLPENTAYKVYKPKGEMEA